MTGVLGDLPPAPTGSAADPAALESAALGRANALVREVVAPLPMSVTLRLGDIPLESPSGGECFTILGSCSALEVVGSEPRALLQAGYWLQRYAEEHGSQGMAGLDVQRQARFPFRVAMPYFSESGAVTDDYLAFLASSGHSGIYLEFHPFLDYNQEPVPLPLSHIFRLRDFVAGVDRQRLTSYVNDIFERAASFGLDGYLYVMEPWGVAPELVAAHPEAVGSHAEPHLTSPLCLDAPAVTDYLTDLTAEVVRGLPRLRGLIVMSEDGTTICDDTCPRSTGPRSERRAALFQALADGVARVRDDVQIVAYSWWWDLDDFEAVSRVLPAGSVLCTRTSTLAPYSLDERWTGTPQDVSLLVDGPGAHFIEALRCGGSNDLGVVDMLPISNGHELITLPAMPAPSRYAERLRMLHDLGTAGWLGYDCGGATPGAANEILVRALWEWDESADEAMAAVSRRLFGSGADLAVQGWQRCTAAMQWFPVELERVDGAPTRHGAALSAVAPLVPFTVGGAEGYELFAAMASGSALAGHTRDMWLQMWADREVFLDYLPRLIDGFKEGSDLLRQAAVMSGSDAAYREAGIAEAAWRCFVSELNLLTFWDLLLTAAARPCDSRGDLADALDAVALQERGNAAGMLDLVTADNRLFYTAVTKYLPTEFLGPRLTTTGVLDKDMDPAAMLRRKIEICDREDRRAELVRLTAIPLSIPGER